MKRPAQWRAYIKPFVTGGNLITFFRYVNFCFLP